MTTPKSYLSNDERDTLMREGGMDLVYLAESQEAGRAGDEKTAWAWLKFVELPAHTLLGLKNRAGSQFIRDMGLRTVQADAAYGSGWLDRA
jgi:hypothetical protein